MVRSRFQLDSLTIIEAAEALGVSDRQVRYLVASGRLEGAYKIGRFWRIPRPAVDAYLARPVERVALTERQLELLRLVALSLTNGGIARKMGVSVSRVSNLKDEVIAALGARGIVHALYLAVKAELV